MYFSKGNVEMMGFAVSGGDGSDGIARNYETITMKLSVSLSIT